MNSGEPKQVINALCRNIGAETRRGRIGGTHLIYRPSSASALDFHHVPAEFRNYIIERPPGEGQ